jgi:hypothetical protein
MSGVVAVISAEAGLDPFRLFNSGTVSRLVASPGTATSSIRLNDDGSITYATGTTNPAGAWFTPTTGGVGASYWARVTVNAGALSSGTAGSWVAISSAPLWSRIRSGIGSDQVDFTLQIASDAAGTNIVATKSISLYAEVF